MAQKTVLVRAHADDVWFKLTAPEFDGCVFAGWRKRPAVQTLLDVNENVCQSAVSREAVVTRRQAGWMQSGAQGIQSDGYFRRRNALQDHLSRDLRLRGVVEMGPGNLHRASGEENRPCPAKIPCH